MAVTVDAGAITAGGSGNTGWSAPSTFLINDAGDFLTSATNWAAGAVGNTASRTREAQSFTAGSSYSMASVVLSLFKVGAPTDNWFVTIETDAAGPRPSGAVLATSANVNAATAIATGHHNVEFTFASPPSITSGTKYWIVLQRAGDAVDASNYLIGSIDGTGTFPNSGISDYNGTTWSTEFAGSDYLFITKKTTQALYQVTQDAQLHVWKSTDNGGSWAELDNAGKPTVNSSTKPFASFHTWTARGDTANNAGGQGIFIGYFSGTNTGRVRRFDICSQTWAATDVGGADFSTDVDFNRNIRVVATKIETDLFYTSLADDADLEYVRYSSSMGGQVQTLAVTSAEASSYLDVTTDRTALSVDDAARFISMWWQHVTAGDVEVRTLTGTTLGTATDVDATAADIEAEHASAVYQTYEDGANDKVLVAFIDADGTLEERLATVGVTSASITQATQHQVSAATSYLGRHLATCKFGSDLYVFASTATAIDVFKDAGADGTWASVENWKTGLTTAAISTVVPITGVGILVSYVDNGNVVVDLYTVSVPAALTVAAATSSAAGESVTLDAASLFTVVAATAPAAGQAVALAGQGRLTVTQATAPAAGEAVTLDAASLFTIAAATAPAAGEAVTLKGQARLPVTEATAPAQSEAVTLDAAAVFAVAAATAPAQGEDVALRAAVAASMAIDVASASAAADSALTGQGRLPVTVADAPAAGEAVTFDAAARFITTEAEAPAQGEDVALRAAVAAALTVTPATAPAQGEAVTLDAAASMVIDTAAASAQGEDVTLDVAANLIAGTATATAQGQAVTFTGQGRLAVTDAPASAEGENVILFGGTAIPGTLTVAPATASASGEMVGLIAEARITVSSSAASATGEDVTLDAAAVLTIAEATATATGETVGLFGQAILTITPAVALAATDGALSGAANLAFSAASADAAAGPVLLTSAVVLDEYIPAGRAGTIIAAGRPTNGVVPAGRTSELIPAGKP